MNFLALGISMFGFLTTMVGIAVYFTTIKKNKVPIVPIGLITSLVVGMILAFYALCLAIPGTILLVLPIGLPAGISIFMGLFFLWVLTQRKTPLGNIKVKIGDSILPFEAKNSQGLAFSSKELEGKRILFKFFRGAWCPYCSAELKEFEGMSDELKKYNVEIIGLSNDTPEEAGIHEIRDGLSFKLLSDHNLDVIKQYGVEHQKALGADSKNTFMMFGLPFPKSLKFKSMSIPTSLLIDEKGVIRWIDQSDDYRIRANESVVMGAVKSVFGKGK